MTISNSTRLNLPPLYHVTSALCLFMVAWILIFPASAFHDYSPWRRNLYANVVASDGAIAPETVTKYSGHYLVHATHILPSAVWSLIIPIQLHPGIRSKYRTLHRWSGYVFVFTSLLMAYGVWVILDRKLGFEQHSFANLPSNGLDSSLLLLTLTLYFVGTLLWAVRSARNGRIADHQHAMIRHVASGIWIAVQRILLKTVFTWYKLGAPFSRIEQRRNFILSAQIAIFVSGIAGEYAIHKLRQDHTGSFVKTGRGNSVKEN